MAQAGEASYQAWCSCSVEELGSQPMGRQLQAPLSTQDAEECHIGGSKIKVVSGQRSCFCVENEVALSAHLLNSSL